MRLIRDGVTDGEPYEVWEVRGDIEGFFEDASRLLGRDMSGNKKQTYREYEQAVYDEYQRVTGQCWLVPGLNLTDEYLLGMPPSEVVSELVSGVKTYGEALGGRVEDSRG